MSFSLRHESCPPWSWLIFDVRQKIRVRIRQAKLEDAVGIAAVVHAMYELRSVAQQPREVTGSTIEANLKRIESAASSTAYVAEAPEGTIIGYSAVHWVPFLFLPGGEAYVTELFVRPADSGKGAGSRLLETVVAEAVRRGCARVLLLNGRDVESYRREFYKNRGWIERPGMANFVLSLTQKPNKAPEPTSTSVTPRAIE